MTDIHPVQRCKCSDCGHCKVFVSGARRCDVAHASIEEPDKVRQCLYFEARGKD